MLAFVSPARHESAASAGARGAGQALFPPKHPRSLNEVWLAMAGPQHDEPSVFADACRYSRHSAGLRRAEHSARTAAATARAARGGRAGRKARWVDEWVAVPGIRGRGKLWHIPEEEAEAAMLKRRAPESNKDAQRQMKRREGGGGSYGQMSA